MAQHKEQLRIALDAPLRTLGCSDQERDLYFVSLMLGPTNMQAIAERMNLARPNIYKVIRALEIKGLARFSDKKKYARNFIVCSPTVVLERFREIQSEREREATLLAGVMPELVSVFNQGEWISRIKVLQGREQFLRLFWSILDEGSSPIRFFGSAGDFVGFISMAEEKKWYTERIKRNLKIHSLLLDDEVAQEMRVNDASFLREIRFFEGKIPFSTSFQLFGNKVVFWQPKVPAAVVIEDEYIVQALSSMFDFCWERSSG